MSSNSCVTRINTDRLKGDALSEWPAIDPSNLVSGVPIQTGVLFEEIDAIDYSVGVWECTAFVDKSGPYPVDEFMLLLDGSVIMEMPDGTDITTRAGEAFIIPKGLECQWKMPGPVRKIFMILDGATPSGSDNISLHRITKPPLDAGRQPDPGALVTRLIHYMNHDRRMQVYTDSFGAEQHGPAPQRGRHLVHVLDGDVRLGDDPDHHYTKGGNFYLLPNNDLTWTVQAGTRLLVSYCDLSPFA